MQRESGLASLDIEPIPVQGSTRDALESLALPAGIADEWSRYAEPQSRTILVARAAGSVAGAAIVTSRPLASYLKIGGIWVSDHAGDPDRIELAMINQAEHLAAELGALVVKRELRPGTRPPMSLPGYVDVAAPLLAAPIPDPAPQVPAAQFNWLSGPGPTAVPYMRQTTEFTCGAAALSMVLTKFGLLGGPERATELDLWRQATTVVACDPYGLAVAASRQGLRPAAVTVSTSDALFTENLPSEQDRELRRFIQGDFRRLAEQAGLDLQLRAFEVGELASVISGGGVAIVLVDELLVHGEACPHWILVHGMEGDHFIAHDPWTEVDQGESWVDAYDVPLSAAALDQIAWTGEPAYRAMLSFVL